MDQDTAVVEEPVKAGIVLSWDDSLNLMIQKQREMFVKQGTPIFDFNSPLGKSAREQLTHWMGEFCKAIIHEACELEDWLPWKHWSHQPGNKAMHPDKLFTEEHLKEVRMEVIDLLHFWLSVAILTGMDATMINEMYCEKMGINVNDRLVASGLRQY